MDREKPEYLVKLPRDGHGLAWVIGIGLVLGFTMYGAWQLYIGTVVGWEKRFNRPVVESTSKQDEITAIRENASRDVAIAEQKLRELADARARAAGVLVDRCIDGVAFRKLPEGGWENLPGVSCSSIAQPVKVENGK